MRSLRGIDFVRVFLPALAALAIATAQPASAAADAFYAPPPDVTKFAPGEIIRSEAISPAPTGARAWKLLYASSGLNGERIAVSGVVIVPVGPPPAGGRPIVAWAHPTTGIAQPCAPSVRGAKVYASIPALSDVISRGYIVVATDYAGLGTPGPHPYLIGKSEGQAVLDSVRAARKWSSDAGSQYALWGFSQGGHAALFAGQLAASYAPELTLAGVAAIAPATDLSDLLRHAGSVDIAISAYSLVAWSKVYQLSLDGVVPGGTIPAVKRVAGVCSQTTIDSYKVKFDSLLVKAPFIEPSLYTTSPWDGLLATNRPGLAPGGAPLFIAQGKTDDLVPSDVTVAFARSACKLGAHVLYEPLADVGHAEIAVRSAPDAIAWIGERFAGKPAGDSCPLDSP